jgi:hypothetical protein
VATARGSQRGAGIETHNAKKRAEGTRPPLTADNNWIEYNNELLTTPPSTPTMVLQKHLTTTSKRTGQLLQQRWR